MKRSSTLAMILVAAGVAAMPAAADFVSGLDPYGDNFLSFRTGPGTYYEEMRRLGPGTYVEVIGGDGPWLRVRLSDGAVGWVFSRYVSPEPPDQPPGPGGDAGNDDQPEAGQATGDQQAETETGPDPATAAMNGEWNRYENPRFGTMIEYPAGLFVSEPASENVDGLSFKSTDGAARFIVFGQFNALAKTTDEMMADDLAGGSYGKITYKRKGDDWYVLSGYRNGNVYYRKVIVPAGGDTLHAFEIDYPPDQKAAYDSITARMARSLRAGQL